MTTKTKIDWCDYTINPVKGLCPAGCSYCYARRLYQRFKWDPTIRYDPYWVEQIPKRRGHRIFVGSTMELFGPWVDARDLITILHQCSQIPHHTFIFLTKRPEKLPKEWPDNCWVGVSATDTHTTHKAFQFLAPIKATVKFISFEPLLGDVAMREGKADWFRSIQWVICGQQTPVRTSTMPKIEWLKEIVEAADRAGAPVFLKDNLRPLIFQDSITGQTALDWGLLTWGGDLRQEFPKATREAR